MKIKKIVLATAVTALMGTAFASSNTTYIVATVNNYPILNTQLNAVVSPNAPLQQRQTALNNLIDKYLIQQYIVRYNLYVTPQEQQQAIKGIAKHNGLSLSAFYAELQLSGVSTSSFIKELRSKMQIAAVRNFVIKQNIHIVPSKVLELGQELYNKAKKTNTLPNTKTTKYLASDILIKITPLLDSAQAEQKLTTIRQNIIDGKYTFSQAAVKYSEDYGSAANNGSLGWNFPQAYIATFAKVLVNTPVGGISKPFHDKFGWQMLQVVATKKVSVDQQYFVGKAYAQMYDAQAQKLLKNWEAVMRSNANIVYNNSQYK